MVVLVFAVKFKRLNASYLFTGNCIKPHMWIAQLEDDIEHSTHARLSLKVFKLTTVKFDEF